MTSKKLLTNTKPLHYDLQVVKELVYDKCGFSLTNLITNPESVQYGACSFELEGQVIEHRVSKITPTKAGQFVTIWKRNKNGITEPLNVLDKIDFVIITSKSGENLGQFIFPKAVLANKGIITQNEREGKRGIRVYPPWDKPRSKQAEYTKSWQTKYFVAINKESTTNFDRIKKLLDKLADTHI